MSIAASHHPIRPLAGLGRSFLKAAAAAALAAILLPAAPSWLAGPALAGDLDFTQTGTDGSSEDGRFVRIGLNKSVVIRLPTEARDVIVGNPEIVDAVVRTKNTAYLFARKVGQTNIFFFNGAGQQIMNIDLEVALDMTALQKLIRRTIPGTQITVDTVNENVILSGTAENATEAKLAEDLANKFTNAAGTGTTVVNAIKISEGDQVMLKVKVVEVQRDVLKTLGVDLNAAFSVGNLAASFATGNPVTGISAIGNIGYTGSDYSVNASIAAMEQQGLVRTLAEPTLAAVSGQKA